MAHRIRCLSSTPTGCFHICVIAYPNDVVFAFGVPSLLSRPHIPVSRCHNQYSHGLPPFLFLYSKLRNITHLDPRASKFPDYLH